ncbi:aminoglycoside phosphotransferase family protein [Streptomyces sp. NPDC051219]|uniref:aminoglycoside phosphotransferase family protein n=1 Tax=Streptomyces sp. NPDC051219 TaxID=3155283 RepID=UPI00342B158C
MSRNEQVVEGPLKGYHHETYVFPLPSSGGAAGQVRLKCREPRKGLLWFDRRCFDSEDALIRALAGHVTRIPEIIDVEGFGLQRFIEGRTLGFYFRSGEAIPFRYVDQLMQLFGELIAVQPDMLSVARRCDMEDRPENRDTSGFLERLILFTEERVFREHLDNYGTLFEALRVPSDGLDRLRKRVSGLSRRPFCLLHGDLHRENFVIDEHDQLWAIDWELAMFGDPLYDLASHLYLMRYPPSQAMAVARRWQDAVEAVRGGSSKGWEEDLPRLLDFKRAQSVYTDVIRAALTLGADPDPDSSLNTARKLQNVLARAEEPLDIESVPTVWQVQSALVAWRRTRRADPTWSAS